MARKNTGMTEKDVRRVVDGVMQSLSSANGVGWKVGCPSLPPKGTCPEGNVVTIYEILVMLDYFIATASLARTAIEAYGRKSINWKVGCPSMPPKMTCKPRLPGASVPTAKARSARGARAARKTE